jgi:nucleoside-diphosphate-sugar epimerase
MKVFITGVTGYLGGSLSARLIYDGHVVSGLVRDESKVGSLKKIGVSPVIGSLDSNAVLVNAAREADAVINAASSDHRGAVEALVTALSMSGKPLLHTSGTSIICDDARGAYESPAIFHDDSVVEPLAMRAQRVEIDRFVRRAGIDRGVRSVVICPSMVYGDGRGMQVHSDQIPKLRERSKIAGAGLYIGAGLNRWSNVYIDDLVNLYLLALEKAPSGSFFFAENGEETLSRVAEAVSWSIGLDGRTASWNADEAISEYGDWARFALASNSRVRSTNARRLLGWSPSGPELFETVGGKKK